MTGREIASRLAGAVLVLLVAPVLVAASVALLGAGSRPVLWRSRRLNSSTSNAAPSGPTYV